jgi:hypothetical protein
VAHHERAGLCFAFSAVAQRNPPLLELQLAGKQGHAAKGRLDHPESAENVTLPVPDLVRTFEAIAALGRSFN